jgi:regulator of protease activity HflC (stomatin/prohibitin superfamily)
VVTAEKQAQANLIRRREETAATRSLLNTAKLMEGNPLLLRLKELESLEKIADKVEKMIVVGGLNALLERTVTLRAE